MPASRSRSRQRKRPMNVQDLWALPRVGSPSPSPDGTQFLVPVTRYTLEANKSETRLWLVPTDAVRAGRGGKDDPARPITRNRQPGRCCDAGCSQPGQPVMVSMPKP